MNFIKRLVVILLGMIMVFTSLPLYANTSDVAATEDKAFEKLLSLGILTQSDTPTEGYITRGDFIRYAIKIGALPTGGAIANSFMDVESTHENYMYISSALAVGLVSGGSNLFRPDDFITYNEAVKVLVTLLGYDTVAQQTGGYPIGYLSKAAELNIFANGVQTDGYVSGEHLAQLLLNTLEAPVLQRLSYGDTEIVRYEANRDETLLYSAFSIKRSRGIVTSNAYTDLFVSNGTGKEDLINIDDVQYECAVEDAHELLGYNTEFYYHESDDVNTLMYIAQDMRRNEVVSIKGYQIADFSTDGIEFYHDEKINSDKVDISNLASYIYNGKMTAGNDGIINSDSDEVILIDNNMDGFADVVYIWEYRVAVAERVSRADFIVYDELSDEPIELEPISGETIIYKFNDSPASFRDIQRGSIIFYAQSLGDKNIMKTVLISDRSIEGTIESISGSDKIIMIDGVVYRVSGNIGSFSIGMTGKFYLDPYGNVAYTDAQKEFVYGYLVQKKKDHFSDVKVLIFTEQNRWVTLELADKLTFGTDLGVSSSEVYDKLGDDDSCDQLITYKVNSNAQIIELNTAVKIEVPWSQEEKKAIEEDVFRLSRPKQTLGFRGTLSSFSNQILVGSNTKVFVIPENPQQADRSLFSVTNSNFLVAGNNYDVSAYNMDEVLMAEVCVVSPSYAINNSEQMLGMMAVTGVSDALGPSGDVVKSISGLFENRNIQIFVNQYTQITLVDGTEITVSDIAPGDIIQFMIDDESYARVIVKRYSISNGKQQYITQSNMFLSAVFIAGKVLHINQDAGRFIIDFSNSNRSPFGFNSGLIGVYILEEDVRGKVTCRTGSVDDIREGDFIYASTSYYQLRELFIIR